MYCFKYNGDNCMFDKLVDICGQINVHKDVVMKYHNYFKIGGTADIFVTPDSVEQIISVIKLCKENDVKYTVIGNGTNLLVLDGGIRGVVIKLADNFSSCVLEQNSIIAQSGAKLSDISELAMKNELSGFEFACGIPGTIGGASIMNAGAYDGEMKDVVSYVTIIDEDANLVKLSLDDMKYGYRYSSLTGTNNIIVEVELKLKCGDSTEIQQKIDDYNERRSTKQPLDMASAGSTFKRPKGHYAGKLIQDSGLRGVRYKNAQVSKKHCGFIVNTGEATASEVLTLIEIVQKTVYDKFGIMLEPEVKIIGEQKNVD